MLGARQWLWTVLSLLAVGCGDPENIAHTATESTVALVCQPSDAGVCPATRPSFQNDVLPILNRDCNSTCHAPNMGQWELANYNDVSAWASLIELDMTDCAMPPADAGVFAGSDRTTVLEWIACGSPNN